MQVSEKIQKILDKYLSKNLELRIQLYNLLAFAGIGAGIAAALIALVPETKSPVAAINLGISFLSYALLRIAEKKRCYRLCSWVWVVLIFMIGFPALFFLCGGHKSGTSCFFILAVVFTALILNNREKGIAVAIEFVIYTACSLSVHYYPGIAVSFESDFIHTLHAVLNFLLCAALLLTILLMRNRMIYVRHGQIEELNRELEARNETLLRYDRMKSDFLAAVAHEINTPLAVIAASSSDTLDLLGESPLNMDEIKHNQVVIDKRVKLIDSILLDLMDTVAIEQGRLSLNRQPVNMRELLTNICGAQFHKLDANENSLEYDIQPDLPEIWADPLRIEQVMVNLLTNAARHTKNGTITVGLKSSAKTQIVGVMDTGDGMDAETMRVVFKHYISKKAIYWQHGIGLVVCRRIIDAHGGEIWIESEEGRGTSVYFSIEEEADRDADYG